MVAGPPPPVSSSLCSPFLLPHHPRRMDHLDCIEMVVYSMELLLHSINIGSPSLCWLSFGMAPIIWLAHAHASDAA